MDTPMLVEQHCSVQTQDLCQEDLPEAMDERDGEWARESERMCVWERERERVYVRELRAVKATWWWYKCTRKAIHRLLGINDPKTCWHAVRNQSINYRQLVWSGRRWFNPKSSHTKCSKMVLDSTLLNSQYYKVRIKGKEVQSREWSRALPYTSML